MKGILHHPEAEPEIDDALAGSPDPAGFRREIDTVLNDVASGLIVHAYYPRTRCREIVMVGRPYSVIYDESATDIRVIAFAHHKRRRGYWKSRLRRP
jgi:toxin ParE1/3/4